MKLREQGSEEESPDTESLKFHLTLLPVDQYGELTQEKGSWSEGKT